MILYEGKAITFKHFLSDPVFAAIAGYDFNIIDVVSMQVRALFFCCTREILESIAELLNAQVRELPKEIFEIIKAIIVFVLCACLFPLMNVYTYYLLKSKANKHKGEYRQEILLLIWHVDNKK